MLLQTSIVKDLHAQFQSVRTSLSQIHTSRHILSLSVSLTFTCLETLSQYQSHSPSQSRHTPLNISLSHIRMPRPTLSVQASLSVPYLDLQYQYQSTFLPISYVLQFTKLYQSFHTVHVATRFRTEVLARQLFVLQELVSIFRRRGSSFKGPV